MVKKIIKIIPVLLTVMIILFLSNDHHTKKVKAALDNVNSITVNGTAVSSAARNKNGLTFKAFGVLSCNSTSNLLNDYKKQSPIAYKRLLNVLFGGEHPLMRHVKIEMGNDGNNSTGADSCTMRFENEEADASRSPGFLLAADAKKINPDIKVSVLRWEMPDWVAQKWNRNKTGEGYEALYKWYRETIFDAYEKYGFIPDYINPDKNETWSPDVDFIIWYRNRIKGETSFPDYFTDEAKELYNNMKIIASDENLSLNIVPRMRENSNLYKAVDAIGFHYSTGTSESTGDYVKMAEQDDKEVWYSEGCGSFSFTEYQENKNVSYGSGTLGGYQSPLALCDCLVKSAFYSRKTHYIFQPAIGSFYEGSQYDHKELLSAREPWSGNIHYDEVIYLLWHFCKFAKTGWENEDNTAGVWRYIASASANSSDGTEHLKNESGRPSYMTLASPDKKDFSTIIVNNSNKTVNYGISYNNMDIEEGHQFELWESKTDSYFKFKEKVDCENGVYYVSVEPFSIVTFTSLECGGKDEYAQRLPEELTKYVLDTDESGAMLSYDGNIMYSDDFEYDGYENYLSSRGNEPRYMVDNSGAFFVEDGRLVQKLSKGVSQWNNNEPNTVVGDHRWMNYKASVDVYPGSGSYAGIVVRQQTGMDYKGSGYSLQINKNGHWTVLKRGTVLGQGDASGSSEGKYRLSIKASGRRITAYVDEKEVYSYEDTKPSYFGRIRLFCGWSETYFDNLKVEKLEWDGTINTIPYALELIDNAADKVSYSGNWAIASNGSSNDWYRSTSDTSSSGASFEFDFTGNGIALLGNNANSASITLSVDGETVENRVNTIGDSAAHGSCYVYYGLEQGDHKAKIFINSGRFVLDAILVFSEKLPEIIIEKEPEIPDSNVDNPEIPTGENPISVEPDVTTAKPTPANNVMDQKETDITAPGDDSILLEKPVIKKIKINKKKKQAVIIFARVKGAKGYKIQRAKGKAKFKTVRNLKSAAKKIKFINKKLKNKTIYRYRIKAYAVVNGKKVYGEYSKVKKVKI